MYFLIDCVINTGPCVGVVWLVGVSAAFVYDTHAYIYITVILRSINSNENRNNYYDFNNVSHANYNYYAATKINNNDSFDDKNNKDPTNTYRNKNIMKVIVLIVIKLHNVF